MTNKNYNSGRAFEYRVKKFLESKGYYVLRSAGSHSPIDLLAVHKRNHDCLLIQCKHGSAKADQEELEALYRLQWYFFNSYAYLVTTDGRKLAFYHVTKDPENGSYMVDKEGVRPCPI